MDRKIRMLARAGLLVVAFLLRAFAQDRYLVRAPISQIGNIAARHNLTLIRSFEGSATNLHLVAASRRGGCPAHHSGSARGRVHRGRGIGQIREPSRDVSQGRRFARWGSPTQPLFPTGRWSNTTEHPPGTPTSTSPRPSSSRWLRLTLSPPARAQSSPFSTPGWISGQPVLASSLVAGYDFTRNIAGGSEMADVDQSTDSILDQSTTSILDQSTDSILDQMAALVLNQSTTAILDQSTDSILDQTRSKLPSAFGHGTMVAGLIHLVAPTAKLMPVKVFTGNGTSTLSNIVSGIYWAVDHGADVISMSFSSTESSSELKKAIDYANAKGVICVASAGNDGEQNPGISRGVPLFR